MKKLIAFSISVVAACSFAATARAAAKDRRGPFAGGDAPKVFPIHPCAVLERAAPAKHEEVPTATFARGEAARRTASIRLGPSAGSTGLFMTVVGTAGETLADPQEVADSGKAMFAFWADLNGDKKDDFVALIWCGKPASTLAFALSSESGYRITSITSVGPGSSDFVDLGDGKCRLVQTSLVRAQVDERAPAPSGETRPEFLVHNLIAFDGDELTVQEDAERFPKWEQSVSGRARTGEVALTSDEKASLWPETPERIFRRLPAKAAATAVACVGGK